MAECPFCKETVGANDLLPSEESRCPACGRRVVSAAAPTSLPPPEPWWVAAPVLERSESPSPPAPPAPASDPWWVQPEPPQAAEPAIVGPTTGETNPFEDLQLPPAEPLAAPERNEVEAIQNTTTPPPLPLSHKEPNGVRPQFRPAPAHAGDDDEPVSLLDRLRGLDAGTAVSFLCLSLALLSASLDEVAFLIKPLAGLGLLVGLLGGVLPMLRQGVKVAAPAVMSALCLVVLLFVGSWPAAPVEPPATVAVSLQKNGMAGHQPTAADEWVDASTNAVQRHDVRVQVVSVRMGPVDLKKGASTTTTPERYLVIRLRASYEGVDFQQTPYQPWADLPDAPSKNAPTLTDNLGHDHAQKTFDGDWKVAGRADVDGLTPGHQVKEVLVFAVPSGDIEHLRLTLPASAFGIDGDFRFRIPRGMIQGK